MRGEGTSGGSLSCDRSKRQMEKNESVNGVELELWCAVCRGGLVRLGI